MGILERIKEIEAEYNRTQKNKATEYHLGTLKAKLAKLHPELASEFYLMALDGKTERMI